MDNATDAIVPGTMLLDRYRVEGLLGEGGLGTVVEAFDTRLKRIVAIKTLRRTSYASDPDQFRALEERFAREAEAGSRMGSHPNLVGVHDLMIDAKRTQYLVLEYVSGGTLAERIARGALPLSDSLRLTTEVARGLHAAHESGLVHRDIKPANIFLTAGEQAKVGDFGIAQIDDISGRTRTTSGHPGTPLYMSPEQERMTTYLRPASDQYSLGLVAFEMLTGRIYRRIGTRRATQLIAGQVAPVQFVIMKMLAEDPDDRYSSMEEVVRALRSIESQIASAETPIPGISGSDTSISRDDEETLIATRPDTPRIGLQPIPPIGAYAGSYPEISVPTRYSRRAVLIGAGGLVLVAGTTSISIATSRRGDAAVATGTPLIATAVAAAAPAQPTPTLATGPTATSAPAIISTVPPAVPIVITAPPIVITATPTPTALPAIPIIITAPPVVITATPSPTQTPTAPSSRLPVVTASELGLSASAFEQPKTSVHESDGNIVARLFTFSRSYLRLYLFGGETGGDTLDGWYRVQRYSLNVPASPKLVPSTTADGRKGYASDVAGVCDEAETKCLPCSFSPQGVVCPSNTGLISPIHWYHVILSAQAPGGIVVADYFCNLADKSSQDCYKDAQTILPSMRVIGSPAA